MLHKGILNIILTLLLFIVTVSLSAEVRVGLFDGAKPVSYMDENGNPAGIFPLVLEEIFSQRGEDVTFISGLSFYDAYDRVLSGELDMMLALIKTAERQKSFDYNQEVFVVSWSQLFVHPDAAIENILDLNNQRIALLEGGQNGNNFLNLMDSFDIPFIAVYYKNYPDMAEAVLQGDVLGMVSFNSYAQSEQRLKGASIIFSPSQSYVAVRKGGPTHLLQLVDEALIQMKKDENSIYQRELRKLSKTETVEVVPPWLIFLVSIITMGIMIVSLFLFLLRRKSFQIKSRLEASEKRYSRLIHSAPYIISVIAYSGDNKWNFIDVNKAFCDKTGYAREEMLTMSLDDYAGKEYDLQLQSIWKLLGQEDSFLLEGKLPVKGGKSLPVEFSVQVFESGGEQYLLSISRDLSERQKLNSAISALQQKYTTIADYNYDWECWLSEDNEFIYNSPSCERISGYKPEEFLENKNLILDIIHPDDIDIWEKHRCRSDSYGHCNESVIEFRLIKKDGSVAWINHQCRTIYGPDKQNLGIRGNFRDITESKLLEEQLAQKQKLSSLGVLAGGIAHDFNNILAIIKGFSDVGRSKEGLDDETVGIFETINKASIRGESLTEQILDFSRNKIAETEPVQISAIISEVYNLIKPSFPSSIRIVQNLESNSSILANSVQVHRVVMNLCTNARLAMHEGGELVLSVRELDENSVSGIHLDLRNQRWMELMIKDNGVGMSRDVEKRAFDPYFTTRKTGEGSGMGLAVVHGLVQQWGGQIKVKSKMGQGTAFYLYLPIVETHIDAEPHETEKPEEADIRIDSTPSKIMIIDDEPMILKLLGLFLESAGYSFRSFSSAKDALEEFKTNSSSYNLALMDMTMPDIQGDELAKLFKDVDPDIPVILCSGMAQVLQDKQKPEKVDRLLPKPFTRKNVLELISELL